LILGVKRERSRVHLPPREEISSSSQRALGFRQPNMPTSESISVAGLHSCPNNRSPVCEMGVWAASTCFVTSCLVSKAAPPLDLNWTTEPVAMDRMDDDTMRRILIGDVRDK
jgi:hypothetical protein